MFDVVIGAAAVICLIAYLVIVSRSRRSMESLHYPPDGLRRADDNQRPPVDGSAGFV